MPVRLNVSAVIGEPLLGVSPPLYVALLLVVAPLEVSPPLEEETLTRSRGLSVVQVWVRLGLGFNQGGSGGRVEADWGLSWVCWSESSVSDHA